LDYQHDLIQNIKETLMISKLSITSYNNKTVNRIYLSRTKTLEWVFGHNNDNNTLDKLQKIILSKIQQLKKEKKKAIYRIETIRIVQEIDNLEFCLNAIVQDKNLRITGINYILLYFFASLQSIIYIMFLYIGMQKYCHL
jgi:hypothetical protein